MIKTIRAIFFACTMLLPGAAALAASFNCKAAAAKVEKLVCADTTLSQRDETLAALYTQTRQSAADAPAEKAMQLAWLKARDACADAACVQRAYTSRIAELTARKAGPMAGIWRLDYSCDGLTDMYEERCKRGWHDIFELMIVVDGERLCAKHAATARTGNRVDEVEDTAPSMEGTTSGRNAKVRFRSNWGGTGSAVLRLEGNALHWKVTDKDGGANWIPDDAVLQRVSARPVDSLPVCTQ